MEASNDLNVCFKDVFKKAYTVENSWVDLGP